MKSLTGYFFPSGPVIPPLASISFWIITATSRSGTPRDEAGPVMAEMNPIRYSWAPAARGDASVRARRKIRAMRARLIRSSCDRGGGSLHRGGEDDGRLASALALAEAEDLPGHLVHPGRGAPEDDRAPAGDHQLGGGLRELDGAGAVGGKMA